MSEIFKKNLNSQARSKLNEFFKEISKTVIELAPKYGMNGHLIAGTKFRFSYDYYPGACNQKNDIQRSNIFVDDQKREEEMLVKIEENLLNSFQQSLDNFAWAVENQNQQ